MNQKVYRTIRFLNSVQVASCTNQMGQIAIVAMQNCSPKVTECFNVESRILCMTFVPAELPQENGEKVSETNHVAPAKASDTPTVCLGMEEGRYRWLHTVYPRLAICCCLKGDSLLSMHP